MTLIKKGFDPVEITTVKILIYGQPGLGKSTYGLTAPRPLMLDFDDGFRRIKPQHRSHADYVSIKAWSDVSKVLSEDISNYDSLVLDTAGRALDFIAQEIMQETPKAGNNGTLTLQGYGILKTKFTEFARQVSLKRKHLVFVAHDKETKDGDLTSVRPDITGGSAGILIREMDVVGYMESVLNKRTINFNPCDRFYGKNTCELPEVIEVEDLNKVLLKDMTYSVTNIIRLYKERQHEMDSMRKEYDVLLAEIDAKVSGVKDLESAKSIGEELPKLTVIWDSNLQARNLFGNRLKALNIGYHKDNGYYFKPTAAKTEPPAPAVPATSVQENVDPAAKEEQPEVPEAAVGSDGLPPSDIGGPEEIINSEKTKENVNVNTGSNGTKARATRATGKAKVQPLPNPAE